MKTWDSERVLANGQRGGYTVKPNSDEFKACEAVEKAACLKKAGC